MQKLWVEAGDTFFTHSSTLLGKLIRWGETDHDEEPTWTNHTGVVVKSGWVGPELPQAEVVESLWKTRKGPLRLNGTLVRFFRPVPRYSQEELVRFRTEADMYVGRTYGWWKLGGFLLKRLTRGKVDLTKLYFLEKRPICSVTAGLINEAARPIGQMPDQLVNWPGFGNNPLRLDPDEMLDFCETNPEFWEEVGK